MDTDHPNSALYTSSTSNRSGPHQSAMMVASVLHLMSHYTAQGAQGGACIKLASVIERHLRALSDLPGLDPVLRATSEQLSEQWAGVVERGLPRPEKRNLFSRIIGSATSGKAGMLAGG